MDEAITEYCSVERLRPMPLNPKVRTSPTALKLLKASIQKRGVIMPLLVTPDGEVIDGHRRLQCAKELGIAEVPVKRVERDEALWSELAETTRKQIGSELLDYYLAGGLLTGKVIRAKVEALEKIGGRDLLVRIREAGLSHSIYTEALAITRYIDGDAKDPEWMRCVLDWLIDGRRQASWRAAKHDGITPHALWTAIREKRDITRLWK